MTIILPIYFTQTFKTKPSKTFLVGMNWYRNAHYRLSNDVKKYYHAITADQLPKPLDGKFTATYKVYYKNPSCDPMNVIAIMDKFVMDAFQDAGVINNDNVKYYVGMTMLESEQDRENPRCEINIKSCK